MGDSERYRSLLLQKKELIFKLLRLSNETNLDGKQPGERDVRYIHFVDARDVLIEQLKDLDEELLPLDVPEDMAEEAAALQVEMKTMTEQIARLELAIVEQALEMTADLRRRIKDTRNRRAQLEHGGEYSKGLRYSGSV